MGLGLITFGRLLATDSVTVESPFTGTAAFYSGVRSARAQGLCHALEDCILRIFFAFPPRNPGDFLLSET
jgi:hypothetical protein